MGTILITKHRWSALPQRMQEFEVRVGPSAFATRIVKEDRTCAPPAHQHLHREARHVRHLLNVSRGTIVEIETQHDGSGFVRDG